VPTPEVEVNVPSRLAAAALAAAVPLLWIGGTAYADEPTDPAPSASSTPTASPTEPSAAPSSAAPSSAAPSSAAPSSAAPSSAAGSSAAPSSAAPSAAAPSSAAPSEAASSASAEPSASAAAGSSEPTEPAATAAPTASAAPDPSAGPAEDEPAAEKSVTEDPEPTESTGPTEPTEPTEAALAALAIEADGTAVYFDPLGCATPQTPAAAILEIVNDTEAEISYLVEVSGPNGPVLVDTLVIAAGASDAAFPDNLPAGEYTITVTPDDGPPLVDTAEVPACPPPTTVTLSLEDPGCGYVFAGEDFAGSGVVTVVNQSDAIVQYEATVTGPGTEITDGITLFGGAGGQLQLAELPEGSYTVTVTTTDLTGEVVGTWTATDALTACVVAPVAEGFTFGCFSAAWYFNNLDSNIPVTFTILGGNDGTGSELTGERLDTVTLQPGEEYDVETRSSTAYPVVTVMITVQGDLTAPTFVLQNDARCALTPRPVTATAKCGVVAFTNPADNAEVVVSWGALDEDTARFPDGSLALAPGARQTITTKAEFLLWVTALEPVTEDVPEDFFVSDVNVIVDAQAGVCPAPPAPAAPIAPAGPPAPQTAPDLAATGAPADGGLVGLGLLAVATGAALLIRGRRRLG